MSISTSVTETTDKRDNLRRARYDARRVLWKASSLQRVRQCGRSAQGEGAHSGDGSVVVRVTEGSDGNRAGFGGLQTCGSVWACPTCSERVNRERQAELTAGIESWIAGGGGVEFGTLTLSHSKRHALEHLLAAISPAWNRTTSGSSSWKQDRDDLGIVGLVRLLELTHGERSGWHPHIHFLLFTERPLDPTEREHLRATMFKRWKKALDAAGYKTRATVKRRGEDIQHVGLLIKPVDDGRYIAEYFAKNAYLPKQSAARATAFEVTGSHAKKAGKGRTPFQVLSGVVSTKVDKINTTTGEVTLVETYESEDRDTALWWEYEKATKGRRMVTWSRGLRALLLAAGAAIAEREATDAELAAEELGGTTVLAFGATEWSRLVRMGLECDVLELVEADPTGARAAAMLGRRGIHDVRATVREKSGATLFAA